jgi:UDP-N-acetyl-alpha-D-muramoyl-L-alanyl-L-glutamate epimerase
MAEPTASTLDVAELAGLDTFRFLGHDFRVNGAEGTIVLRYRLEGAGTPVDFAETVTVPAPAGEYPRGVLDRVLDLLLVAAGTSYYKVAAPPRLVSDVRLHPAAAPFFHDLYTLGLGEFAYRNNLPHVLDLTPDLTGAIETPTERAPAGRPVVNVGGGKDSIVSIEATRAAGLDPVLFAVNPNKVIDGVFAASGLTSLSARRRLDPLLFALNASGRALNGHIPVTAINSLISVAVAVLHGLGPVLMSNERSASSPNTVWNGHEINHQWSKSLAAEAGLAVALAAHAGLAGGYFSLLRPFSELHIARMFAPIERYDAVVTSCNRAFLLHGGTARWCGDCPKCRFVFLALAPYVARPRLHGIFGKDMLTDPEQIPGYLELAGISAFKPFECVGEVEESLIAVQLLREQGASDPVLNALADGVPEGGWPTPEQRAEMFTMAGYGLVPREYQRIVDDLA